MSQHKAIISWTAATPDYMSGKYSREHTWSFDGGLTVPASSSPAVVRAPMSNPANVDPEEAYVASLSSCHMLTFLHVARLAGFQVDRYDDEAVGDIAKNERGTPWVATVTLNPKITYGVVAAIARERARVEVAGVVVTHGTDTLEETAFLADLLIAPGKPVIFTGAQAAADEMDRDGPRNLADAIRLAGDPAAIGLGVLVIFDGDILPARDATKMHTSRRYTFRAASGPIGHIDQDIVRLNRRPAEFPRFAEMKLARPVDLITLTLGGGERLVRLIADADPKGLVLEATGRGNATPLIAEMVEELAAKGVPVVITSRSPEGRVAPIYGQGGGADLKRAGAIFGGDLSGPKARLLLAVILGQNEPGDIAARVATVADAAIN